MQSHHFDGGETISSMVLGSKRLGIVLVLVDPKYRGGQPRIAWVT